MKKLLLLIIILISFNAQAATVTNPNVYANGDTVTAAKLNQSWNALGTAINGGLDNTNVNTSGGFHLYEILSSLPSAGTQGRTVYNTSDNTLNTDTGAAWQTTVSPTGTLATGKIPYYSAGWQLLTPGTANYPLVSNGVSSNPSYQQVSLTAGVTGTLPIANGGTGQTTAQAAVDALLPSQASASGKFLTSNGSASSWGANPALSNVIYNFTGLDGGTITAGTPSNGTYGWYNGAATEKEGAFACNTGNSTNNLVPLIEGFRWKKIAGVSTLTVLARVYASTATCLLRLDVNSGALTSNKALTGGSVYTTEAAFTLDVSSLSAGTTYPIEIYGYDSTATQSLIKISSLTILGS